MVQVIDGHLISSSKITEHVNVECTLGNHHESLTMYVTSPQHYPLVLGILWLKRHDVDMNFGKMDIQFTSPGCLPDCTVVTLSLERELGQTGVI
jgi:hypothetical protein